MSMETTMKQLSQLSGYSISTVSKALNDKNDVSQKARKKIKTLANSYNYVPNNSAVVLRSKRTNTIAVVVPKIDNIIYSSILNSIQLDAFQFGYRVILQQYLSSKNGDYACLDNLRDGCVDGIIVIESFSDRAFSKKNSEDQIPKHYPTLIYTIENLTLGLKEYKTLGKKIVRSLFSKIGSKNSETIFSIF